MGPRDGVVLVWCGVGVVLTCCWRGSGDVGNAGERRNVAED
jgi:hypothetical protein